MADLKALEERAWRVRQLYAQLETARHGRPWSREEVALGFMGDVGDLAKLVLAAEGVRRIEDAPARLAHERHDCLCGVTTLVGLDEVHFVAAFLRTMDQLEARLTDAAAPPPAS